MSQNLTKTVLAVICVACNAALAADVTPKVRYTGRVPDGQNNGFERFGYEVVLPAAEKEATAIVTMGFPVCSVAQVPPVKAVRVTMEEVSRKCRFQFTWTAKEETVTSIVYRVPADTGHGKVSYKASDEADTKTLPGPEQPVDPNLFRPVLGVGPLLLGRSGDSIDFKELNGVLRVDNDSTERVGLVVGGLFGVSRITPSRFWPKRLDIFASINFVPNSANTVNGFTWGLAWQISPVLSIFGGYANSLGQELELNFRRRAAVLTRNDVCADEAKRNPQLSPFCNVEINPTTYEFRNPKLYSGFPLTLVGSDGQARPLTPNSPITSSWNQAFHFGIALPINLKMGRP